MHEPFTEPWFNSEWIKSFGINDSTSLLSCFGQSQAEIYLKPWLIMQVALACSAF